MIFALPLDFHGRVRVVRSMYLPAALHAIEASLLASDSLREASVLYLSSCLVSSSTFGLMLMLSLAFWMGPLVETLHFVWSGFGFVCFVGILPFDPLRLR